MTLDVSEIPGPRIGEVPGSLLSTLSIIPTEVSKEIAWAMAPQLLVPSWPIIPVPPIEWPPEFLAACKAIAAYKEGDEALFWAWVGEYLGQNPDPLLKNALDKAMKHTLKLHKDLPIPGVYKFLRRHEKRIFRAREVRHNQELADDVQRKMKRYGNLELALSDHGDSRQRERQEIQGATYIVESELQPGQSLTISKVEWRIIKDNPQLELKYAPDTSRARRAVHTAEEALTNARPGTQEYQKAAQALREAEEGLAKGKVTSSLDTLPQVFEDMDALLDFTRKNDQLHLEELSKRADLGPEQLAVLALELDGRGRDKIAAALGITRSTVDGHMSNIREALGLVAQ